MALKYCVFIIVAVVAAMLPCGCGTTASSCLGERTETASVAAHQAQASDSVATEKASAKTVRETSKDTIVVERTVVVREADSAELAKYGIAIDNERKAYVIMEREMRERIRLLEKMLNDSVGVKQTSSRSGIISDSVSTSSSSVMVAEKKDGGWWKSGFWQVLYVISPLVLALLALKLKK